MSVVPAVFLRGVSLSRPCASSDWQNRFDLLFPRELKPRPSLVPGGETGNGGGDLGAEMPADLAWASLEEPEDTGIVFRGAKPGLITGSRTFARAV